MSLEQLRVAVLGAGPQAERWAAAVGQSAAVARAPDGPPAAVEALVVAPGAGDAFPQAREALAAGIPVLYAAPFLLSPWQAAVLEALSRRHGCLLRVAEPFQHLGSVRFLQRLTCGREPLWQLRYVRTTSLAPAGAGTRIDELAVEDLALCEALLGGRPLSVMAMAAQPDGIGDACAIFLTVRYRHGPVAQCTISLAEAAAARRLVAVTSSQTVVVDRLDRAAPIRIMANSTIGEVLPANRALTVPGSDPVVEEVRRFVEALVSDDRSSANGERWVRVAAMWWAARQSMSFGDAVEVPAPAVTLAQTEAAPPPLRVIEGGGRATRAVKRPSLTLIAR